MFRKKLITLLNLNWFRWSLFTAIGSGLGFLIDFILSLDPDRHLSHYFIELAIIGLFTSLGQWVILRTQLRQAWLWIPATTLGLALGHATLFMPNEIYTWIYPISVGLFVGVFQSLAMHSSIKNSLVWVIVSTLSWGLAYWILLSEFYDKLSNLFSEFFFGTPTGDLFYGFFLGTLTGLVIGAISGLVIGEILAESRRMDLSLPQKGAS